MEYPRVCGSSRPDSSRPWFLARARLGLALLTGGFAVTAAGTAQAARDLTAADGPGDTYALLQRAFNTEVPDCGHMQPHITEEMDADLGKPVFVFHAHVGQDDDRCGKTDRQRTEIRGKGEGVQGTLGSTLYYRWKMKLPAGFQVSPSFTHLMQIKAYGNGHGSGAPIMTLAGRSPGDFGIDGRIGKRVSTPLSKLINEWVLIDLKIFHSNSGTVSLVVRRLRDKEVLINYTGTADMYDDGAEYGAPKFGIYRSLNNRGSLRDEQVRFADFCVSKTSASDCDDGSLPPPGDGGAPLPDAGVVTDATADPDADPDPEDASAGYDAPVAADAGSPPGTGGNSGGSGGSGGSSAPRPDAGRVDSAGSSPSPGGQPSSSGCSCRVGAGERQSGAGGALLAGLTLVGLIAVRRRRRSPRA